MCCLLLYSLHSGHCLLPESATHMSWGACLPHLGLSVKSSSSAGLFHKVASTQCSPHLHQHLQKYCKLLLVSIPLAYRLLPIGCASCPRPIAYCPVPSACCLFLIAYCFLVCSLPQHVFSALHSKHGVAIAFGWSKHTAENQT